MMLALGVSVFVTLALIQLPFALLREVERRTRRRK